MKTQGVIQWIGKRQDEAPLIQVIRFASIQLEKLLQERMQREAERLNVPPPSTVAMISMKDETLADKHGVVVESGLTKEERTELSKARGIKVIQYRKNNLVGESGKWLCLYCGRRLSSRECNYIVECDYSVIVLRHGEDFMAQACSQECRASAADNYVKEKEWLRKQLTDLKAMRRMVNIMSQEVSKLPKQELELAKSSPAL